MSNILLIKRLIGRPESHIKNVTLDNVQISAKKGIDIRFVDNLVLHKNRLSHHAMTQP